MDTAIKNAEAIIEEFMKWMESQEYSSATMRYYRLHVEHFLRYLRKQESQIDDLKQVDRAIVARYRNFMQEEPLYTEASREQRHYALRALFKWLIEMGVIVADPTTIVDPSPEMSDLPLQVPADFFTEEEIQKLFAAHDASTGVGRRNRAMIEVMYYCGLRNIELASLKVEHIDLEYGDVTIPGARRRKITLIEGFEAVKEYGKVTRPMLQGSESCPWFFLSKMGGHLEADEIMEVIQEYVERAGISSKAKPRTMLNSRALHMLLSGSNIRDIQTMLGFKDSKEAQEMFRELAAANSSLKDIEDYL